MLSSVEVVDNPAPLASAPPYPVRVVRRVDESGKVDGGEDSPVRINMDEDGQDSSGKVVEGRHSLDTRTSRAAAAAQRVTVAAASSAQSMAASAALAVYEVLPDRYSVGRCVRDGVARAGSRLWHTMPDQAQVASASQVAAGLGVVTWNAMPDRTQVAAGVARGARGAYAAGTEVVAMMKDKERDKATACTAASGIWDALPEKERVASSVASGIWVAGSAAGRAVGSAAGSLVGRANGDNSAAAAGADAREWKTEKVLLGDGAWRREITDPGDNSEDTEDLRHFNAASAQFQRLVHGRGLRVRRVDVYGGSQALHRRFIDTRDKFVLSKKGNKKVWVFHGTADANIEPIMTTGFKVGGADIAVAHGAAHGKGVYTAVGPNTPMGYGKCNKVILAQAYTGQESGQLPGQGGRAGGGAGEGKCDGYDSWRPRDDWLIFKTGEQLLPTYVVHY